MRSRAARLTLSITAWAGLGAAAFFLVNTEQQLARAARSASRLRRGRAQSDGRARRRARWPAGVRRRRSGSGSLDSSRCRTDPAGIGQHRLAPRDRGKRQRRKISPRQLPGAGRIRERGQAGPRLPAHRRKPDGERCRVQRSRRRGQPCGVWRGSGRGRRAERIRRLRIPAPHMGSVCAWRRGRMVRARDGDSCVRRRGSAAGVRHGRRGIDVPHPSNCHSGGSKSRRSGRRSRRLHRPPRLRRR